MTFFLASLLWTDLSHQPWVAGVDISGRDHHFFGVTWFLTIYWKWVVGLWFWWGKVVFLILLFLMEVWWWIQFSDTFWLRMGDGFQFSDACWQICKIWQVLTGFWIVFLTISVTRLVVETKRAKYVQTVWEKLEIAFGKITHVRADTYYKL